MGYIANAKLPTTGRTTREQIISGLGSLSKLGPHGGDDKMTSTARLVFLSDDPEVLVRVKLIDSRIPPICVAWLCRFVHSSVFGTVITRKAARFPLTFSQGTLSFHDVRDAGHLLDRMSDLI